MEERDEASRNDYPLGRGYGHDYMRGGEVLGGYGYSEREEYSRPRGELLERRSEPQDEEDRPETD
ncbi:MAG TPA: hypothetical protein VF761_09145 [Gemmatimonadaceae bacterium]